MGEYHESALKWQKENGGEILVLGDRLLELHIVKTHSDITGVVNFAAFPLVNGRSFRLRLDLSFSKEALESVDSSLDLEEHIKEMFLIRLLEDVFEAAEGALSAK